MSDISLFCLTLNPSHEDIIKKLSYIPVGLGEKNFQMNVLTIKMAITFHQKINFMENILFITGFGRII